jgi:hypothetical protein
VAYLDQNERTFDVIIASGVLYHMLEPLKLLYLISKRTNRCLLWTHYYDEEILRAAYGDKFPEKFSGPIAIEYAGYHCQAYTQGYGDVVLQKNFGGGNAPTSNWLSRDDIIGCLRHVGFSRIEINHENPQQPGGPAFSIAAASNSRSSCFARARQGSPAERVREKRMPARGDVSRRSSSPMAVPSSLERDRSPSPPLPKDIR